MKVLTKVYRAWFRRIKKPIKLTAGCASDALKKLNKEHDLRLLTKLEVFVDGKWKKIPGHVIEHILGCVGLIDVVVFETIVTLPSLSIENIEAVTPRRALKELMNRGIPIEGVESVRYYGGGRSGHISQTKLTTLKREFGVAVLSFKAILEDDETKKTEAATEADALRTFLEVGVDIERVKTLVHFIEGKKVETPKEKLERLKGEVYIPED